MSFHHQEQQQQQQQQQQHYHDDEDYGDHESTQCFKWFAFFSEKEGREYYYNPKDKVATWILPDDGNVVAGDIDEYEEQRPDLVTERWDDIPKDEDESHSQINVVSKTPKDFEILLTTTTTTTREDGKNRGSSSSPECDHDFVEAAQSESDFKHSSSSSSFNKPGSKTWMLVLIGIVCVALTICCRADCMQQFRVDFATMFNGPFLKVIHEDISFAKTSIPQDASDSENDVKSESDDETSEPKKLERDRVVPQNVKINSWDIERLQLSGKLRVPDVILNSPWNSVDKVVNESLHKNAGAVEQEAVPKENEHSKDADVSKDDPAVLEVPDISEIKSIDDEKPVSEEVSPNDDLEQTDVESDEDVIIAQETADVESESIGIAEPIEDSSETNPLDNSEDGSEANRAASVETHEELVDPPVEKVAEQDSTKEDVAKCEDENLDVINSNVDVLGRIETWMSKIVGKDVSMEVIRKAKESVASSNEDLSEAFLRGEAILRRVELAKKNAERS